MPFAMYYDIFSLISVFFSLNCNLNDINEILSYTKPEPNVLICSPDTAFNMQMFTINSSCILRSQLGANYYVDITVNTSGITYSYVANNQTIKSGWLIQF